MNGSTANVTEYVEGVLQTITDRGEHGESYSALVTWFRAIGDEEFERIVGDGSGTVEWYFDTLANDSERSALEDFPLYDTVVGPAVDRVSDAYQAYVKQQARPALITDLGRLGCTGYIDPDSGLLTHDSDTCPVHEDGDVPSVTSVPALRVELTPELRSALRRVQLAYHGDSNDEEIGASSEALAALVELSGLAWPEFPEEGATYQDDSHPDEPVITVASVELKSGEPLVELTSGAWYVLVGPEGFLTKLDAGIIRRIESAK